MGRLLLCAGLKSPLGSFGKATSRLVGVGTYCLLALTNSCTFLRSSSLFQPSRSASASRRRCWVWSNRATAACADQDRAGRRFRAGTRRATEAYRLTISVESVWPHTSPNSSPYKSSPALIMSPIHQGLARWHQRANCSGPCHSASGGRPFTFA